MSLALGVPSQQPAWGSWHPQPLGRGECVQRHWGGAVLGAPLSERAWGRRGRCKCCPSNYMFPGSLAGITADLRLAGRPDPCIHLCQVPVCAQ